MKQESSSDKRPDDFFLIKAKIKKPKSVLVMLAIVAIVILFSGAYITYSTVIYNNISTPPLNN